VGDPVALAQGIVAELGRLFEKELGGEAKIPIKALTVFTHPVVELDVEGMAVPSCRIENCASRWRLMLKDCPLKFMRS
jgi:hypothetical protein